MASKPEIDIIIEQIKDLEEKLITHTEGQKLLKKIISIRDSAVEDVKMVINEVINNLEAYRQESEKSAENAAASAEEAINSLTELKSTVINIRNSVEGRVATAEDCSDKTAVIYIYGESIQGAVPTVDKPVTIIEKFTDLNGSVTLENGTDDTQTVTFSLDEPLRGVPCIKGKENILIDEQPYVCDYISSKNGVAGVYKNVVRERLTSSGFSLFKDWEDGRVTFAKYHGNAYATLCSHFLRSGITNNVANYTLNTLWNTGDKRLLVTVENTYTIDTFKDFVDNNEIYIYGYSYSEPVFTAFSDDVQSQFKSLKTCYGVTSLYNSNGAYSKLEYTADTKLYIDNKFDELKQAILSTGGNV